MQSGKARECREWKKERVVFGHPFFLRGYMANYWEVFFFFFSSQAFS